MVKKLVCRRHSFRRHLLIVTNLFGQPKTSLLKKSKKSILIKFQRLVLIDWPCIWFWLWTKLDFEIFVMFVRLL